MIFERVLRFIFVWFCRVTLASVYTAFATPLHTEKAVSLGLSGAPAMIVGLVSSVVLGMLLIYFAGRRA